jgi:hypothetical protein
MLTLEAAGRWMPHKLAIRLINIATKNSVVSSDGRKVLSMTIEKVKLKTS